MSATIAPEHGRPVVIEPSVTIVSVDGEVPTPRTPYDRANEIVGSQHQIVLPVEEDVAQIVQAELKISSIEVAFVVETHQIIQIYLVCVVVLLVVQVELVGHLVRQIECFLSCTLVAHGIRSEPGCGHYQGDYCTFHSRMF